MYISNAPPRLMVRLPRDVKEWLAAQAERNAASQASEIVRAVRERMERCAVAAGDQPANKAEQSSK
jgi:hypothetical protein